MIELPSYNWFVTIHDGKPASNTYTGSWGTDPSRGCFSVTTFNYKVSIKNVGTDNARILCSCFLIKPWSEGAVKEEIDNAEYACSPRGLEQSVIWLNEKLSEFKEKHDK